MVLISLGFSDLNFDGSVDMIGLYANTSDSGRAYLKLNYNGFSVSPSDLCSYNSFSFAPEDSITYSLGDYYPISKDDQMKFLMFNRISFGDFDLEGFPDVIINLKTASQ